MQFAPEVLWRVSRRGLVIAGPEGDAVLLDHPRAAMLPEFLAGEPDASELAALLGEPNGERLVAEMTEAGILTPSGRPDDEDQRQRARTPPRTNRVVLTRSGAEITGIERPARWIHRHLTPGLFSLPGRVVLAAVVAAGVVSLLMGRPDGPTVSDHPAVDALLGLSLGLLLAALHELAHAVALVHYGRHPRRAGFGFYWGGICFYVDSTEAMTLPRRARVIQALAGLAVDVVTVSLLAVIAQLATPVLVVGVFWRLAILGLLEVVTNLMPVLEVDGHWALADYLDEPELGPRARAAFGSALRRSPQAGTPRWLSVYGGVSLVGGLALLVGGTLVWWAALADLLRSLFDGNLAELMIGILLVGPFAVSVVVSSLGLLLEVLLADDR